MKGEKLLFRFVPWGARGAVRHNDPVQPVSRRGALLLLPLGLASLAHRSVGETVAEPLAGAAGDAFDAAGRVARSSAAPQPSDGTSTPSRAALSDAVLDAIGGPSTSIGVSVLDRRTGVWWHHRGDALARTGSVSKALAVGAALRKARAAGTGLSAQQPRQAQAAITQSDNDSASALYAWIGGHSAVAELAADLGMNDTAAAGAVEHWGHTLTTPNDLVRMMRGLTAGSPATHPEDDAYLLGLMGQVVDGQRWGVGTVRSSRVKVRGKNGWMRVDDPWVVNSVGDVRGAGRDYVLVLMQRAQPDEATGFARASRIGRAVFAALEGPLR